MKRTTVSVIMLMLLFSSAFALANHYQKVGATGVADFNDEFDSPTLNPAWTWVDPSGDCNYSLTANQGYLRISAPRGDHDLFPAHNLNAPRLVQSISGDFIITTRVLIDPQYDAQAAGFFVWKDSDNFLLLDRTLNFGAQHIQLGYMKAGSWLEFEPSYSATTTYLRLERSADIFIAKYSEDGINWNALDSISLPLVGPVNIGLLVINQWQNNPIYADFDYFRMSTGVHIIEVPTDFPTIQEAINNANTGDTVFVRNGTYSGPIAVNKTITLQGEHRNATIIDGGANEPSGSIVLVVADNVKISGFTIQHCRGGGNAVYLDGYGNMTFSDNVITGNNEGVRILHSSGNVISYNIVQDCYYNTGVGFDWSYNNTINHNTIIHNHYGLSGGYDNHNNTYSENTIINNDIGFGTNTYEDKFFHNNFVNNGVHVIATGANQFDAGYPSGGNYWSDYTDVDLYKGPSQNETGSDGIWDHVYVINPDNVDRYPFTQPNGWIPTLESGLVGYWRFDEGTGSTAYDSSGNDNNGTVYGATWVDGRVGQALSFDGSDDHVLIDSSDSIRFSERITVASWVKVNSTTGDHQVIVSQWNSTEWNGFALEFALDGVVSQFCVENSAGARAYAYSSITVPVGSWAHLAGVFDGSFVRIYVNGTLAGEGTLQGSMGLISQPILIGENLSPGDWNWFNGVIDDVRVYDRSLSADEIMALYGFTPPIITGVARAPDTPNYDEEVTVTANIKDDLAVDDALLSYSHDLTWHNVSMSRSTDMFNATIPAQAYATHVHYRIYAKDTSGNWAVSDSFSYTVTDNVKPQVIVSQNPGQPRAGQVVKIYANIVEPLNASGVRNATFHYRVNGNPWWSTSMIFNEHSGLWETSIPSQQAHDLIEYYIKAQDNAGNENATETFSYLVALQGDANLDHIVDVVDAACISAHWYPGPPIGPLGFDPFYDLNGDGYVNIVDSAIINGDWKKAW